MVRIDASLLHELDEKNSVHDHLQRAKYREELGQPMRKVQNALLTKIALSKHRG